MYREAEIILRRKPSLEYRARMALLYDRLFYFQEFQIFRLNNLYKS